MLNWTILSRYQVFCILCFTEGDDDDDEEETASEDETGGLSSVAAATTTTTTAGIVMGQQTMYTAISNTPTRITLLSSSNNITSPQPNGKTKTKKGNRSQKKKVRHFL